MNDLQPKRLKEARERLGITMAEAARRLNLSKIGYCRYEYGDRIPSPQTVEIIAQCFGTSVDYLVGNTDDISPNTIVIHKDSEPIVFEFIQKMSSLNPEEQKRLLAYFEMFNKITRD